MQLPTYVERTLYTGDINPANIIVSNSHYSNLQGVDLKVAYEKTFSCIACKARDLGEAYSQSTKTNILL